jgi:hypothetical protein
LALLSLVGESTGRWPCLRVNSSVTLSADIQDSCEISACL